MAPRSRWHDPPRLRTLEGDDGDERHATWLELFFDLVFVVAIAQLADGLAEDPSVRRFLIFAGLFVAVWWAWVGYTFYADRFDTDDPPHRVLMIAGMFAVAVLASVIPDAFRGETVSFALAYAGVRAIVVLLNLRAWWHLPAARPLLNVYIPAFTASILIFLVSTAVEPPYRYWLWALALVVDLGTPLASAGRIRLVPIHASHIPERVGLFTIIVFGESVLAVVVGTSTVSWGGESAAAAALGFGVAGALWWIYFDYVDSSIVRRTIRAGQIYLYAHLPLLIGLTALGAGIKLGIKATQETGLTDEVSWIIGVGGGVLPGLRGRSSPGHDADPARRRALAPPGHGRPRAGTRRARAGSRDRPAARDPGRGARRAGRPRAGDPRAARPSGRRDRDRLGGFGGMSLGGTGVVSPSPPRRCARCSRADVSS
jgi:low temperature requirement protein LtrA